MAGKRKRNGAAVVSLPKRSKTGNAAPAVLDDTAGIEAASAAQNAPQREPQQFDESNEIRSANVMRFALQQESNHTPALSDDWRRRRSVSIKPEPADSDVPSSPLRAAGTFPAAVSGVLSTVRGDRSQQVPTALQSDDGIAVAINAAARLLRQFDSTHVYFRTAVEVLQSVYFTNDHVQFGSIAGRLTAQGVPLDRAQEVAAILHRQTTDSMPLNEAAVSLNTVDKLDGVLATLQAGSPNESIRAQLACWHQDVRNEKLLGAKDHPGRQSSVELAPSREFGNLISQENRGGSVYMSGGLRASPDNAPRNALLNVGINEQPNANSGGEDDFVRTQIDG